MSQAALDHTQIKGWGIDADPKNDPTYPMRHRGSAQQESPDWQRPQQQHETVEVLHSIERPGLTAVFGTALPPAGLSGIIRRFAFRFSESSYAHWLPLMLADRVNEVEGLLDDLMRGRLPNVFLEMGWRAEWKYNRARFLQRIGAAAVIATAAVMAARRRRRRNPLISLLRAF